MRSRTTIGPMNTANKLFGKGMETKNYIIGYDDLAAFRLDYERLNCWKSEDEKFFIKAWVSEVSETGLIGVIVSPHKPDNVISPPGTETFTKRTPQDDEFKAPSRKDTLWGDFKRMAMIAAREIKHKTEDLKRLPRVNLHLFTQDKYLLSTLGPGEGYWFRVTARKGRPLKYFVLEPVVVAAALPLGHTILGEPYKKFQEERERRARMVRLTALVIVAAPIVTMGILSAIQPKSSMPSVAIKPEIGIEEYRQCPDTSRKVIDSTSDGGTQKYCVQEKRGNYIKVGYRVFYSPSGRIRKVENWSRTGRLEGEVRRWHENGQLASIEGVAYGLLNGTTVTFDESGKQIFEAEYENGELIKTVFPAPSGVRGK